jgi:hypothetical protein
MTSRPTAPRWAFWMLALALLLKAAVPLLATASAHAQGKTLVEVCTVYGVATVALDAAEGKGETPAPASPGAHGEHCTLSSLLAFAAPPAPAPALLARATPPASDLAPAGRTPSAPDASARWVAGLKHAPPAHG